MLSDVTYGFISGTSVARDFVELPSQLYEHAIRYEKDASIAENGALIYEPATREMPS